jgi:hypothetical protein
MENVYFFEITAKNEVEEAIKTQAFRNIRIKKMDCKELGSDRVGYFLYLRGRTEFLDRAEEILKNIGIEKLRGDERTVVLSELRKET